MLSWSLFDLKEVFCMLRLDPASFDPDALSAMARLCAPGGDCNTNEFRQVLRCWQLKPHRLPYIPRWILTDSECAGDSSAYGSDEECALLRSVLHTAAQLRREEKLTALSRLADAAHNFPAAIIQRDSRWSCSIRQELQAFCREFNLTLLPPPPPDRDAVLRIIRQYAGQFDAQEEQSNDPS